MALQTPARVSLRVTRPTQLAWALRAPVGFTGSIVVTGADGAYVDSAPLAPTGTLGALLTPGRYTVMIDPDGMQTATVRLTLRATP